MSNMNVFMIISALLSNEQRIFMIIVKIKLINCYNAFEFKFIKNYTMTYNFLINFFLLFKIFTIFKLQFFSSLSH